MPGKRVRHCAALVLCQPAPASQVSQDASTARLRGCRAGRRAGGRHRWLLLHVQEEAQLLHQVVCRRCCGCCHGAGGRRRGGVRRRCCWCRRPAAAMPRHSDKRRHQCAALREGHAGGGGGWGCWDAWRTPGAEAGAGAAAQGGWAAGHIGRRWVTATTCDAKEPARGPAAVSGSQESRNPEKK